MSSIGVFTIASKNYLAYVRVLMSSLAKVHPEYKLYLCLADHFDGYFDPTAEPYTIIETEQLGIPDLNNIALRYDIMEFNTAVKPFMFRWLFEHTNLDAVIYLDPDIQVYSRFDCLESLLGDGASVVLTPHITRPLEDGKNPDDYSFLKTGVFNLGFIAVRRCDESGDFIDWWGRRLLKHCTVELQVGLFVDQKWCDLAPCFLGNLKILRNEGYNIAYWNLAQRKVSQTGNGQWLVNQSPLVFFHFSGVSPSNVHLVSKHQDRFSWKDVTDAQPLFKEYNKALMQAGWKESHNWPYAFDEMLGWGKINRMVRMYYRSVQPRTAGIETSKLADYIRSICNEPCNVLSSDGDVRVTQLMYFIYCRRDDLQSVFVLDTAEGRKRFAEWFEQSGPREYDLPPELTQQNLIQDRSDLMIPGKKAVNQAYSFLLLTEPTFRRMARILPSGLKNKLKRFWLVLKSQTLKGF